jgi:membrane protein
MRFISPAIDRLRQLWQRDIWIAATARKQSLRSRCYAALRVLSITLSGLHEIHVAIRAAALSYSSLLSLGPLVAILVLISGLALGNKDPAILANGLHRVIGLIVPQVDQIDAVDANDHPETHAWTVTRTEPGHLEAHPAPPPDPELVKLINNFITHSRSGAAGIIGVFTLLIIVIQLFTTIENTFNDIWGVRRGRSWLARIIYYWSAITLGALLFFAALTLFSAGAFMNVFLGKLPMGAQIKGIFVWMLPFSSVLLLMIVLTLFYRLVPNTRVRWTAAFAGAVVVTGLLFLNNYVAFLYFRQVFLQKSLYGSVAILPVLMLGLYVFWFFVLVGGQLTYAIQNVHYRSSQAAWHTINHFTREGLSLLVLLLIARRFKSCRPAFSVTQLAEHIHIPSQILNEGLNRLCDLGLITQLPPADGSDQTDHRYQPARPLNKVTLQDFKHLFEHHGDSPSGELLDNIDPLLAHYHQKLAAALPQILGQKTIDELLDELPLSESRVPFPMT